MGDFEKGKRLIVEGWELLCKLYEPYFKIMEGAKLLDLPALFVETNIGKHDVLSYEHAPLIHLGLDTFLSSLRTASNVDELKQAIEDSRKFWDMIFPTR